MRKNTVIKSFEEMKDDWRKYCGYWRVYPDKFIDFIKPPDCKIDLFFYQRLMLRILFRYRKVYFTFTRGTSKSFIELLGLKLKCIMYPGIKVFICAPRKKQAADIAKENIEKIWEFFPLLHGEVKEHWFQNDYTRLKFWNGSVLDVVQVSDSARGGRRNGGSIEEIVDEKMKKDDLHSVVIPLMANDRIAECKGVDPNEIHKFEWYITTAGTKQSFAYEKMREVLYEMAQGKSSFNIGAGYDLACSQGLLSYDFINELKELPTFNPLSFAREYESVWTGTSDNSLVKIDDVNQIRVLKNAEEKYCNDKNVEYILSYDVARSEGSQNANCALCVIKIIPRGDGTYQKHLVNIYSFEGTHFMEQAKFIKSKVNDFKASVVVIDSNGAGKGLVDILVTECDENPPYSVVNDDRYDKYKAANSIPMIYALSSNTKEDKASDIHNIFINYINNKGVKILHSESQARAFIDKKYKDSEAKANALMPFIMTDLLCEEIMNLEYKQSGNQTQVKQISRSINKDKFSALEYGLYYIYKLERKNAKRRRESIDISNFFLVKQASSKYKRW
ncbi:DNA-packaging protein (plasmid) [Paenibacillus larvae subsp. pulvifaciens]|uniref:DNA-packaging protein n=1 Tax=Paenibacillus larvae subsp. pulvifaciens TaxID=1477 RepID=A0A1V0V055_9BACL|nr:DNA-packaging protein [Paenibacillus larvae subsp. pulvifaciens]